MTGWLKAEKANMLFVVVTLWVLVKVTGELNEEAPLNIKARSVTLEQSKLIGWLKLVAVKNMLFIETMLWVFENVMG